MYELENAKAARHRKIVNVIMWVVLLVLFIAFIFPFIIALLNVFKANADINRFPLALVGPRKGFILSNFPTAMTKMHFWRVFGNSAIITVTSTVLTLLFAGMCAFVVTRNDWVACRLIFAMAAR